MFQAGLVVYDEINLQSTADEGWTDTYMRFGVTYWHF